MSTIDLMLDEENELTFQVNVEGTQPAAASCRLIVSGNGMDLLFETSLLKNDEVSVVIPPLKHVLSEGIHDLTLEVVVDDRLFTPLQVKGNFEKRLQITAESVTTRRSSPIKTSATLINASKPARRKKVMSEKTNTAKTKRKKKISDNEIMSIIKALTQKSGK
jgi:hypothetical protein